MISGHHPYVCRLCGMKYKTLRMFNGHVKQEHPATDPKQALHAANRLVIIMMYIHV